MRTECRVSREEREREGEREHWVHGVRDRAFDKYRNGLGWKWPLVKKDTLVFQNSKSIE